MTTANPIQLPVSSLAGIGAQSALRLEKLGIFKVEDLLFHLPLRYQDRSKITPINQLIPGSSALITGTVDYIDTIQRGRSSLICKISDDTGSLNLRFFHFSVQQTQQLKPGTLIGCFGEIRYGYNGIEMAHPDYKVIQTPAQILEPSLTPIYPLTEGLSQSSIRKAIKQALHLAINSNDINEWLPATILQRHGFPALAEALQLLHNPPANFNLSELETGEAPGLQRLAFEELLAHHLALLAGKKTYKTWQAPVFAQNTNLQQAFISQLPFNLTAAQHRVIQEIAEDCQQAKPMLRLVQGDVGCGKTVVAAISALTALYNGYQVALMAPTELLAEQHFRNFSHWFADTGSKVIYLSSQIKGKARQSRLLELSEGSAGIIIGTHALFQDSVEFNKLGLIIIDEQHRFGVHQRQALREKGQQPGFRPHQLIMTATPIPRTLAMLNYSDLDISIIDELPAGRKTVATRVISNDRRQEVISRIANWTAEGKQAYWVCTLIEESEQLQCEAAEKTAFTLTASLPGVRIGLVHGRLKAAEKEAIMQSFKAHELDLLVATTVIEVGVDVANANLMVIENPERLGLSQLHQLRGRVGRGNQDSFCILLYQAPLSEVSRQRLNILKQSNDGFYIAEQDLLLRGPGEVMGTRQTGQLQFKIADLRRDNHLLDLIPQTANLLEHLRPDAIQPLIKRWIGDSKPGYQEIA